METQKIVNLLNDSNNESSKFATRKWYIINDQINGKYGRGNENDSTIKFEKEVIKLDLCDYLHTRCITHINDEHVETSEDVDVIVPMYNLIEYCDNYADFSGSLYQFKRDESPINDARNHLNVALYNSTSFKYKASLLRKATDADGNARSLKNAKIIVPLKY